MLGDGVCVGCGVAVAEAGTVMPTQMRSPNGRFCSSTICQMP